VFSRLGEMKEVQSSVPLRIKRISSLDVKIDGSLKVKIRSLVITNYETRSNSKGKIKGEEQASSYPVTVREADDQKAKTGSTERQKPEKM